MTSKNVIENHILEKVQYESECPFYDMTFS